MFKQLADWLDDRTGAGALLRTLSGEEIPGGARWRYVLGSALASVFLIQAFTGMLMMTAYSPSSATAWGSVYYINHVMWMGWIIRGLHHFGAQAVMMLVVLHLLQVVIAGAYRKPREVNWWFGLALLVLMVGFSHTGYQLPWDQKGILGDQGDDEHHRRVSRAGSVRQDGRRRWHGIRQPDDHTALWSARGDPSRAHVPLPGWRTCFWPDATASRRRPAPNEGRPRLTGRRRRSRTWFS